MSEESKKVFKHIKNDGWILEQSVKIACEYASSANANPSYIPELVEDLVHLFTTGEQLKR